MIRRTLEIKTALIGFLLGIFICIQGSVGTYAEESDYSLYDELIEQATELVVNDYDDSKPLSDMFSSLFIVGKGSRDISTMGYYMEDLDGNGVEELLFGMRNDDFPGMICDLYTIVNGKVEHVFTGWNRCRYYLCKNGAIANEGSGGALYTNTTFYRYEGQELSLIESIFIDGVHNDTVPYFYSTTREFGSEGLEPVSDEFAEEVRNKYVYKSIDFIPFVPEEEFEDVTILDEVEEDVLYYGAALTGHKNDSGYGYVEELDINGNVLMVKGELKMARSREQLYDDSTKGFVSEDVFHFMINEDTAYISTGEDEPYEISQGDFLHTAQCYNGLGLILVVKEGNVIEARVAS